ncbi:MAG: hypothetical protein HQ591_00420 [candidate division Zixibacteria bacterium]|nr:hypothetical protein [Candidatus Tariuqbacter arcticus]
MRNPINRIEKTTKKQDTNAFIKGVSSLLEIMPPSKPYRFSSKIKILSDNEALADDWRKVGEYMWWALNEISEEINAGEKQK